MNKNSTITNKVTITLAILTILSYSSANAQATTNLQSSQANQDITSTYSVLAVNYQSFDVISYHNAVNLNWAISASATNDHFEVERSFDQSDFSTAALILGAQSENEGIEQYSFQDKDKRILNHAIIYYRLKKVDVNGSYTYSAVKMVRMTSDSNEKISVQAIPDHYTDKKAEVAMIRVHHPVM